MIDIREGQWAVLQSRWGYMTTRVDKVTAKLIKTLDWGTCYRQNSRDDVVAALPDEKSAKALRDALDDAQDALRSANRDADERFEEVARPIREECERRLAPHYEAAREAKRANAQAHAAERARLIAEAVGQ